MLMIWLNQKSDLNALESGEAASSDVVGVTERSLEREGYRGYAQKIL